jgi:hypothetical protein
VNATAATGTNQATLLAAFTLPIANAAPATPAFVNMISLMLSSPNQPAARTAVNPWSIAATPAQIADAMIRSMLGSPQAVPVSADPGLNDPAVPVHAGTTDSAPAELPTANRKPTLTMPAATPVEAIVISTPISTPPVIAPPAGDSKGNVAVVTTPQPVSSSPAAPLAKNSPEMKVAFSAILTPLKDTPAIGAASPELSAGAVKPSTLVVPTAESAAEDAQPATPMTSTQATSMQVSSVQISGGQTATQADGDSQLGGDASSEQKNDSAETPAKPVAPASETKIKPAAQQDDNALPAAAPTSVVHAAGAQLFAAPTDSTRTSAASESSPPAPEVTPYNATGEALRTTESDLAAAPQLRTGAAQEISIRIAPTDSPAVDLRLVERAGQVHVDVRTADATMQTSLRQDLGTLTNSLERAGYHTETFTPSSTLGRAASSAQTGNNDHQQDPSQNRGGSGDFSGGRRQQQQQKRPGTWLEELEEQK